MFKNLSLYKYTSVDEEVPNSAFKTVTSFDDASLLIYLYEPRDPSPVSFSCSGIHPVDLLMLEQSTNVLTNNFTFVPLTQVKRERVIDSSAVNFEVNKRIKRIEHDTSRTVSRKEITNIKDEVVASMLGKAPIKEKRVRGVITSHGDILVDAVGKVAEDYINFIRSLFSDIHISIFELKMDGDQGQILNAFSHTIISDFDPEMEEEDIERVNPFYSNASFQFEIGEEKITVNNGSTQTLDETLMDRLNIGTMKWLGLSSEHSTFRLTSDLRLKSIKLHDFEYEPESDDEGVLSAAYHRFYLTFFLKMIASLRKEIADTTGYGDVNE